MPTISHSLSKVRFVIHLLLATHALQACPRGEHFDFSKIQTSGLAEQLKKYFREGSDLLVYDQDRRTSVELLTYFKRMAEAHRIPRRNFWSTIMFWPQGKPWEIVKNQEGEIVKRKLDVYDDANALKLFLQLSLYTNAYESYQRYALASVQVCTSIFTLLMQCLNITNDRYYDVQDPRIPLLQRSVWTKWGFYNAKSNFIGMTTFLSGILSVAMDISIDRFMLKHDVPIHRAMSWMYRLQVTSQALSYVGFLCYKNHAYLPFGFSPAVEQRFVPCALGFQAITIPCALVTTYLHYQDFKVYDRALQNKIKPFMDKAEEFEKAACLVHGEIHARWKVMQICLGEEEIDIVGVDGVYPSAVGQIILDCLFSTEEQTYYTEFIDQEAIAQAKAQTQRRVFKGVGTVGMGALFLLSLKRALT